VRGWRRTPVAVVTAAVAASVHGSGCAPVVDGG